MRGFAAILGLVVVHGSVWTTVAGPQHAWLVHAGRRVELPASAYCCGQLVGARGGVWVAGPGYVLRPRVRRVATPAVCIGPFAFAAGALWRVDGAEGGGNASRPGRLCRTDIATGARRTIRLPTPAIDVAAAGGAVWVGGLDGSLFAFDTRGRLVRRLRLGDYGVIGLAAGRSGFWATNGAAVFRLDARSGRVLRRYDGAPDFFTGALAVGDGGAFVLDGRLRLRQLGRRGAVPVPAAGPLLAVGGGAAWVVSRRGRLVRIRLPLAPVLAAAPHGSSGTCRDLRGSVFLNGETGSLVAAVDVVNAGTTTCTLVGRPAVRFADEPVVVRAAPGRARTIVLRPGRHARTELFWSEWCGRDVPVVIAIGPVRVRVDAHPRCDDPSGPSFASVSPWER